MKKKKAKQPKKKKSPGLKLTICNKLEPTPKQREVLEELGLYSRYLYNCALFNSKDVWNKTGKIPSWYDSRKPVKDNYYKLMLPSQSADEVLHNLYSCYRSWFELRKKDSTARPPGFKHYKDGIYGSICFFPITFKIKKDKITISMSLRYRKERAISSLTIKFDQWRKVNGEPKYLEIFNKKGKWYASIVYKLKEPKKKNWKNIMAIDLGMINQAVTLDRKGEVHIFTGRGLLAMQNYKNRRKARMQSKMNKQFPKRQRSRAIGNLCEKIQRQIDQSLHKISKEIINIAIERKVGTIVVGDLVGIRKDEKTGKGKKMRKKVKQNINVWPFAKFTQQLIYKGKQQGVEVVKISERNTSKTCSNCGDIEKTKGSKRIKRGYYKCKKCGLEINADINGAKNILNKYLQEKGLKKSNGNVTLPIVHRIDNTIPMKAIKQEAH